MIVDASTFNATNGFSEKNIKLSKLLICAISFGIFQFIMLVIGYFIGSTFKEYIEKTIP